MRDVSRRGMIAAALLAPATAFAQLPQRRPRPAPAPAQPAEPAAPVRRIAPIATLRAAQPGWFNGRDHCLWSSDGAFIVTNTYSAGLQAADQGIRIWNAATGALVRTIADGPSTDADLSPDNTRLVTTRVQDNTVRIYAVADGRLLASWALESEPRGARFSPDGTRVLTGRLRGTAQVWNAADGRLALTLNGSDGEWSPDGSKIAVAVYGGVAVFTPDGRQLYRVEAANSRGRFSRNGAQLLTGGYVGPQKVWDASSGALLAAPTDIGADLFYPTFSPDGSRVATTHGTATTRLMALPQGNVMRTIPCGGDATFSPDSAWAVFDGAMNRCNYRSQLWDVRAGRLVGMLAGAPAQLAGFAFAPDSRRFVGSFADGTVRIWATG